jgi:hypothetical protein
MDEFHINFSGLAAFRSSTPRGVWRVWEKRTGPHLFEDVPSKSAAGRQKVISLTSGGVFTYLKVLARLNSASLHSW